MDMEMDYKELGRRVRQRRVMLRLTQEELAKKADISCSCVGHIERGEKKFSIGTLVALCNAMEISPNHLLQDSLNANVLNNSLDIGEQNRAFYNDMMDLLREHQRIRGEY